LVTSLARLRRVQLERYLIMDNILDHVLLPDQRPLVTFSRDTVVGGQQARLTARTSGSYLWTLALILPTGAFLGLALGLVTEPLGHRGGLAIGAIVTVFSVALLDQLYQTLSRP
jgi:hypothetical protein